MFTLDNLFPKYLTKMSGWALESRPSSCFFSLVENLGLSWTVCSKDRISSFGIFCLFPANTWALSLELHVTPEVQKKWKKRGGEISTVLFFHRVNIKQQKAEQITCYHIWILPIHNIPDPLTDKLVQRGWNLIGKNVIKSRIIQQITALYLTVETLTLNPGLSSAYFEQIGVVIHHKQNCQVQLSFGQPSAVNDGSGESPFHCHSVLNLTGELNVNEDQT